MAGVHAQRSSQILGKNLEEGKHYVFAPATSGANPQGTSSRGGHKGGFPATSGKPPLQGGRPIETILLTLHGFKQLCMAAGTDKARRVREYYITMEGVLFEYTRQQLQASQVQPRNKAGTALHFAQPTQWRRAAALPLLRQAAWTWCAPLRRLGCRVA